MSTPDTFEELTTTLRRPSPLSVMCDAEEDTLLTDRPEGFTPEDMVQLAWDSLPERERDDAWNEFKYTYWAARQNDLKARARYEREQKTRTALAACLDEREMALVLGNEVSPELNTDIAALARTLLGGAR